MSTVDKKIFRVFLIIIIILIGIIAISYFKTKDEIEILSKTGNEIIKTTKQKTKDIQVSNKIYEDENKFINYPYINDASEKINEKIKSFALQEENTKLNYEIKFINENLISIVFYGKKDNNNYSKALNILNENIIEPEETFKEKNEMAIILKSTYASEYLEKNGEILKQAYLDNLEYENLLNNENISVYFTKENIGIIVNNIPNGLKDYISIEINYNELNNHFIEKETQKEIIDENKIKEFILNNNLISPKERIENVYPEGYIFTENGNFAYYKGENDTLYQDQIVSSRGNWWIENNLLILHVTEEEKITNGEIVDNTLINYQKIITPADYNIEFTIENIEKSYMMINNYDIILNNLKPDITYIEKFKILADIGYKEYQKIVQ